jgi:hypothetical protein
MPLNDQIVANGGQVSAPNRLEAQRRERSAINELAIKLHYCDVLMARVADVPWRHVHASIRARYVDRATRAIRENKATKFAVAKITAEEAIHVELERRALDLAAGIEVTGSRVFAARLFNVAIAHFDGSLSGKKVATEVPL